MKKVLLIALCVCGVGGIKIYAALNCPDETTACFSLKAVDADNAGRQVSDGGTLYMVVSDTSPSRTADITATPDKDATGEFDSTEPEWTGQTSGGNGDETVSYTSSGAGDKTIEATAAGGSKSVTINLVGKMENQESIGNFKTDSTMHNMKDKLKFPGGASFIVGWSLGNTSYNSEQVDKYNDPGVDWKRQVTLGINGSLTGRITHPQFSGSVGSWALWELYASASLSGSVSGGVGKDPSISDSSWKGQNLTASVIGSVAAGYYVYCNVPFVKLEGDLSVSTSVTGSGQLASKDVQFSASWGGLAGNVALKCYCSDPNDPWVDYSGTETLIAGNETGWVTAFSLP